MTEQLPSFDNWKTSPPMDYMTAVEVQGTIRVTFTIDVEYMISPRDDTSPEELAVDHVNNFLTDPAVEDAMRRYGLDAICEDIGEADLR